MYFRIIIPTYGKEPKLKEAIESVRKQNNFERLANLIVSHDNTDYKEYLTIPGMALGGAVFIHNESHVFSDKQLYNGGNRNFAMNYEKKSVYTLFLDHDDTIPNIGVLQKLHDFAEEHGRPDMIRLPYTKYYESDGHRVTKALKGEDNFESIVKTVRVAPWTKAVKTELIPEFPENTTFEDVIHHLKCCDICETYARFPIPVVEWRIWNGQTSKKKDPKWESSKWRFVADLMDLKVKKPAVEKRRLERIRQAKENLEREV